MKFLVGKDDEIHVKFACAYLKSSKVPVADTTVESLKKSFEEDIDESTIEEHEVVFRRPTFGDSVDMAASVSSDGALMVEFKPLELRKSRMAKLLKSWTLKDGDKPIPATPESIEAMDPIFATVIGIQLDVSVGF